MVGIKLNSKLTASTLLEVLIAMVTIMTVFGIAMMIFTNVTQSSLSVKKIQAERILNDILLNDQKSAGIQNQTLNVGDFRVEQVVKSYNNKSGLLEVDLTAFDAQQQQISELHKIIIDQP